MPRVKLHDQSNAMRKNKRPKRLGAGKKHRRKAQNLAKMKGRGKPPVDRGSKADYDKKMAKIKAKYPDPLRPIRLEEKPASLSHPAFRRMFDRIYSGMKREHPLAGEVENCINSVYATLHTFGFDWYEQKYATMRRTRGTYTIEDFASWLKQWGS